MKKNKTNFTSGHKPRGCNGSSRHFIFLYFLIYFIVYFKIYKPPKSNPRRGLDETAFAKFLIELIKNGIASEKWLYNILYSNNKNY